MTLSAGDPAPDFTARNQHGESITLSELRGAPVVVIFYPWAFSGICTGELAALQAELERFRAADARVLAVSCDAMFSLRVYADEQALDFDLLSDHWPHGAIAEAYGVFDDTAGCALRGTFVIDRTGVITWRVVNQIGEARELADLLAALRAGPG